MARTIGPRLGVSGRARRNVRLAFPDMAPDRVETIITGMWENLGRVAAEYPHLAEIEERVEVVGEEHISLALGRGRPVIFFSAHLGNWEIAPSIATRHGVPLHLLYRPAGNPLIDALVRRARFKTTAAALVPRGLKGVRFVLRRLAAGQHLGMLVDQKVKRGIYVPFFGRDALTTRAVAHLALKFDGSALPVQIERLTGAYFRLIVHPAVELFRTGEQAADERAIMTGINAIIEGWVRQRPEQWLWLHRRWPEHSWSDRMLCGTASR